MVPSCVNDPHNPRPLIEMPIIALCFVLNRRALFAALLMGTIAGISTERSVAVCVWSLPPPPTNPRALPETPIIALCFELKRRDGFGKATGAVSSHSVSSSHVGISSTSDLALLETPIIALCFELNRRDGFAPPTAGTGV